MEPEAITRLQSKEAGAAIVERIRRDFQLTPAAESRRPACLLCRSLATIKRDVHALRQQGLRVPTRGQVKDIGKGVNHKGQIVGDYLAGYTFSEIARRRHHSVGAIRRYGDDFVRIIRLHPQGVSLSAIRSATGLSERLMQEYLTLYQQCPAANDRLQILPGTPEAATATPAEIKRGRLMR
jgi:hypothetical protein